MDRQELLTFIKGKVSNYYYDILYAWTKKRERKFLFFKRKFDVEPTILLEGYVVKSGLDHIILYKD